MARLVLDGLELQDIAAGIWGDIIAGGLDDLPTFVGTDDDLPAASGRYAGQWHAGIRPVTLQIHVWGVGASPALRRAAYRAKVNAVMGKMDVATLIALVAHPPNEGLAAGTTATLSSLRPVGSKSGPPSGWEGVRTFELKYESIASPPNWVIA